MRSESCTQLPSFFEECLFKVLLSHLLQGGKKLMDIQLRRDFERLAHSQRKADE